MGIIRKHWQNYKSTISYIIGIVLVNAMFTFLPLIYISGQPLSPGDLTVGIVYILRDFAQREIQHKVIIAMLVGGVISYSLASQTVAMASVIAFFVGETIEWLLFTLTKKPLSQRLLWSALISVPIDSYVFLLLIHRVSMLEFVVITGAKFLGVLSIWFRWRIQQVSKQNSEVIDDDFALKTDAG